MIEMETGIIIEKGWGWLNWFGGRLTVDGEASPYAIEVCGPDYEDMNYMEYLRCKVVNAFNIRAYESNERIPLPQVTDLIRRLETEPVYWRTEFGGLDEIPGLIEESRSEE